MKLPLWCSGQSFWLQIQRSAFNSLRYQFFRVVVQLKSSLKKKYTLRAGNSVRTAQKTHYVSATKPNRLMLFRETVAVYCENHTEHINTPCG
jgi:hypothetical protein